LTCSLGVFGFECGRHRTPPKVFGNIAECLHLRFVEQFGQCSFVSTNKRDVLGGTILRNADLLNDVINHALLQSFEGLAVTGHPLKQRAHRFGSIA
jgi:hypothetical protein